MKEIEKLLLAYIKSYKKVMIPLSELEARVPGDVSYRQFAEAVHSLEQEGILARVQSHGENGKTPSLAYTYRIKKKALWQTLHDEIQRFQLTVHPVLKLGAYLSLPEEVWQQDRPYIEKIDAYLKTYGLPNEDVPAPERAYELVGDEKWIVEGNGKEVLERIQLWERLKIIPVADPLMLAVNPNAFQHEPHFHLIVENKTTYQALQPVLSDTFFTSLIYGAGNKIISSIIHLEAQLHLEGQAHRLYYFGDVDLEGISIWYRLHQKIRAEPALPFYRALLQKPFFPGKETQRRQNEALTAFMAYFSEAEQHHLREMLAQGGYYPQEALTTFQVRHIWRNASWTAD
ncbi:hypothetical protein CathTA2_1205 [Caldalkalibacillus thermarum TA2.A1]|uniref:DUF2220 domain-containing protein n=1 Tax=Caldalkalibacillus thermarum (strain TA2.A1) TaxID=986075 RepID=F5L5Z2_CALTT|nr:Wadjet anti-phage system protein JetD domain-containing protein [Caldalkalibacillus thermarum]EGL83233.1 hypothetical protein CathTA2_1205 [Caldalkalibacillus thermarum TA2.A1]QZT35190.1 DUF2220 domain-containing protein [Caldalkalibacillus thermarum TA2.A1]